MKNNLFNLSFVLFLSVFSFTCLYGQENGFTFSAPEKGNTSWGNKYFRMINFRDKNHLMSIIDKEDGKYLLTRSWLWYSGRTGEGEQLYKEYSEENNIPYIGCEEQRSSDKQIVTTRYQTPDYDIARETTLFADRPYLKLRYTLESRHDDTPGANFPLLVFPKSFDQVVINNATGFSEQMPFDKVTAPMLARTHLIFLISKELKRTVIILANLNTPLDLGYDIGTGLSMRASWGNFVSLRHPKTAETKKKMLPMVAEVFMTTYRGTEFNEDMLAAAMQIEQSENIQPRYQDFRFPEVEKEQLEASEMAFSVRNDKELKVWAESSLKKVYLKTAIPKVRKRGIEIKVARNEGESFQIALSGVKELQLEELSVEKPKGKKATFLPEIKTYWLEYQETATAASGTGGLSGMVPDKLMPIEKVLPRQVPINKNQPLWFTVNVPEDAVPGVYRSRVNLTFRRENKQLKKLSIPVKIEVWNFALPKNLPYRAFGVGWSAGSVEAGELLAQYHFNNTLPALDKNDQPQPLGKAFDWTTGKSINMDGFFRLARKAIDEWNYNSIMIPFGFLGNVYWRPTTKVNFGKLLIDSDEFQEKYPAYLSLVNKELVKNNLQEDSFIYMWDEVLPHHYPAMNKTVEMARKAAPGLKVLIVGVPNPDVIKIADIIVPGGYYLWWNEKTPAIVQEAKKQGKEFWLYDNGRTFARNVTAADTRLVVWQSWPRGVTGYLQWAMAAGWDKTYATNGETWLIYPMKEGEEPIASLKLENFRDGIEDFTYFDLMKNLDEETQNKFNEEILQLVPMFAEPVADIVKMNQIRNELGEALSKVWPFIEEK